MYELPGAKKIALISHGNAGNILQRAFLAEKPLSNDCSVFAYDYSGYGRSEGEPSLEGMAQDGDGAYKYLLSQNYKPQQIILFGESIGTLVSGELARIRSALRSFVTAEKNDSYRWRQTRRHGNDDLAII